MGVSITFGEPVCPWYDASLPVSVVEGTAAPAALMLCKDSTDPEEWHEHVSLMTGTIGDVGGVPRWIAFHDMSDDPDDHGWDPLLIHDHDVPVDVWRLQNTLDFVRKNNMDYHDVSLWRIQFLAVWKHKPWLTLAAVNQYGEQVGPGFGPAQGPSAAQSLAAAGEMIGKSALTFGKMKSALEQMTVQVPKTFSSGPFSKHASGGPAVDMVSKSKKVPLIVQLIAQKAGEFLGVKYEMGQPVQVTLDALKVAAGPVHLSGVDLLTCPILAQDWKLVGLPSDPIALLSEEYAHKALELATKPALYMGETVDKFMAELLAAIKKFLASKDPAIDYHGVIVTPDYMGFPPIKNNWGDWSPEMGDWAVVDFSKEESSFSTYAAKKLLQQEPPFEDYTPPLDDNGLPMMIWPDNSWRPVMLAWYFLKGHGNMFKPEAVDLLNWQDKKVQDVPYDGGPTIYRNDLETAISYHVKNAPVPDIIMYGPFPPSLPGSKDAISNVWKRMGLPNGTQVWVESWGMHPGAEISVKGYFVCSAMPAGKKIFFGEVAKAQF